MRTLFGFGLVLGLSGVVPAQDKKDEKLDPAKLVGKWEGADEKQKTKLSLQFTDDGKTTVTVASKVNYELKGTYKVDGNKIIQSLDVKGKTQKSTLTVLKFADEEMVIQNEKGAKMDMKRVKDEKKD